MQTPRNEATTSASVESKISMSKVLEWSVAESRNAWSADVGTALGNAPVVRSH